MRRLCWIAAGVTAALLAGCYLLPFFCLPWAALVPAVLACCAPLLPRLRRQILLFFCAAAAGLLWFWGYTALTVLPAEAHAGERREVTLLVTEDPAVYDGYTRLEGVALDDELRHARMLVYDYDGGMTELRPGDLVRMPLKLLSARSFSGEESMYYLTEGIHLRGYLAGEAVPEGRAPLSVRFFPKTIARNIKAQALRCFPADAAPLMKALLTGDRTEYNQDDTLYSAMRTAGFSHVVAVSGMHVAFLLGLLRLLAGSRRKLLAGLGIPALLVFLAMTGFTPSVTRAGVMQAFLLLAPVLRRESDAPTSLSAALLLLLLVNPWSAASMGLQLSFAATAGLVLLSPRLRDFLVLDRKGNSRLPDSLPGRLLEKLCGTVSASLGAMLFTTPLSALYFGFVPLYSLVTNLLCLPAMSAAFLCGFPVCLLGLVRQSIGALAGWCVGWLPRYVIFLVRHISRWPFAALVVRWNLAAWWLVFVYVLFPLSWLFRNPEEGYRPVLPACAALITLSLLPLFLPSEQSGTMEVTMVDVGQGESIVAATDRAVVMVDCGSTSISDNAGDRAAEVLLEKGRNRVDLLVLTHFHADHVNGVRRLMSRVDVSRLVIAADYQENDYSAGILADCEKYGTEVYTVTEDLNFYLDELLVTVYAPLGTGDPNEECLLIRGDYGEFEFLVTGDAGGDVERLLSALRDLGDMELLVVGHHGSRYSTTDTLLDDITPETAFISVGADNDYGHPAPEVLERLKARHIRVYRTDLDGTVSLTAEG